MSFKVNGFLGSEAKRAVNVIRERHQDIFELASEVNMYANDVVYKTKIDSGTRNFQLKFSIWSIRKRGREYFIHMITQYPNNDFPRKTINWTMGRVSHLKAEKFSKPKNPPYPPKNNIAINPPKVNACRSSPA